MSYSPTDRSYTYRGSPVTPNQSPMLLPPKDLPTVDDITDVDTLKTYLKDFDRTEKLNSTYNLDMSTNLLSSFWSHPVTKSAKDSSSFLRKSFYQLSTRSPSEHSNQLFFCRKIKQKSQVPHQVAPVLKRTIKAHHRK